jgi:hypothetical protein
MPRGRRLGWLLAEPDPVRTRTKLSPGTHTRPTGGAPVCSARPDCGPARVWCVGGLPGMAPCTPRCRRWPAHRCRWGSFRPARATTSLVTLRDSAAAAAVVVASSDRSIDLGFTANTGSAHVLRPEGLTFRC